jgi:folate-binding protein YgfZ
VGDGISAVSLYPADGQPRALWIAPAGQPRPPVPRWTPMLWQWSEVRSGIVTVTTPIIEAFVPQMLNYESVGGVNFKKGCYPGQEVVARSQFRGTLKRRAFLVQADAELPPARRCSRPATPSSPSAPWPRRRRARRRLGRDRLACRSRRSRRATCMPARPTVRLLQVEPLPYPLLEDI